MHAGELIEYVLEAINDRDGVRYGAPQVGRLLQRGYVDFFRLSRLQLDGNWVLPTDVTAAVPFSVYMLPPGLKEIKRVENAQGVELPRRTVDQVSRLYASWRTVTGTPACYVPLPEGRIQLVPAPQDSTGPYDATPTLYGIKAPGDLMLLQEPEFDSEYHLAPANWAIAWILLNDDAFYDEQKASLHQNQYQAMALDAKKKSPKKGYTGARAIPRRLV